jgi:hypothetical protein
LENFPLTILHLRHSTLFKNEISSN